MRRGAESEAPSTYRCVRSSRPVAVGLDDWVQLAVDSMLVQTCMPDIVTWPPNRIAEVRCSGVLLRASRALNRVNISLPFAACSHQSCFPACSAVRSPSAPNHRRPSPRAGRCLRWDRFGPASGDRGQKKKGKASKGSVTNRLLSPAIWHQQQCLSSSSPAGARIMMPCAHSFSGAIMHPPFSAAMTLRMELELALASVWIQTEV